MRLGWGGRFGHAQPHNGPNRVLNRSAPGRSAARSPQPSCPRSAPTHLRRPACTAPRALVPQEYCPNDVVWVQDYHLMLLPQLLKQVVPKVRLAARGHDGVVL